MSNKNFTLLGMMRAFFVLICIFFSISIPCFCELFIEEFKIRTHPVELMAFLIQDRDTGKKAVYVLDYWEFNDNQSPQDIVKNFKPIKFEDAQDCFYEKKLNKNLYFIPHE